MSSSSTSGGQDSSEPVDLIKIINPNDFDVYEDYVDAYICADDIKFLQVQSMSCWNQTLESFIDKSSLTGFGSFKITFTSGSDWIISCNFLRKCVNFNKMIFNHPMNVSDISRLQIYRGNAFKRSFSAKSYVRNCI